MTTDSNDPPDGPQRLVEGVDYTIDAGRWVFSAAFLKRRGTCCGSGCRNCPFRTGVGSDEVTTQE